VLPVDFAAFSRYDSVFTSTFLNFTPDFRFCQGCRSGGWVDYSWIRGKESSSSTSVKGCPDAVCPDCEYSFCTECHLPGHSGMTCRKKMELYVSNNPEMAEKRSEKWVNSHAKQCPQCFVRIQRTGGCNHMTCSRCKTSWCWFCGNFYVPGAHTCAPPVPAPAPAPESVLVPESVSTPDPIPVPESVPAAIPA